MKLEKLNTWLTFAGHIAILLGLIALALEIRQNTSAVRAQELGDLQNQTQERRTLLLTTDLSQTYLKSLYTPSELTIEEIYLINSFLNYRLDHLRRYHRAFQDGIINEEDWKSELINVPIYLNTPIGKLMWDLIKADFAEDTKFVAAVDAALTDDKLVPDDQYFLQLQEKIAAMANQSGAKK